MTSSRGSAGPRQLRLALAQINVTVGDLAGNAERIVADIKRAGREGVDIVAFPELALTGYPPEDLLLKPEFIADNLRALERIAAATADLGGVASVVGFVDRTTDLYNAAAVLHGGQRVGVFHKRFLPNYGVFDENRYFSAGGEAPMFEIGGVRVGVNICEDIWYPTGPAAEQAAAGAELLLNISASPYFMGKQVGRERMLATRAADSSAIVAYCNLVGGQDELVFDGFSVVFDQRGDLLARAKGFDEDFLVVELDVDEVFSTRLHDPRWRKEERSSELGSATIFVSGASNGAVASGSKTPPNQAEAHPGPARGTRARVESLPPRVEDAYSALMLGVADYVRKNGFRDVVIGLSGGIDSALTAAIAVDALGMEHVWGVSMPSKYSSEGSKEDARVLAHNLGTRFTTVPIEGPFESLKETLREPFSSEGSAANGLAEENLQARIRGNILMALSNRFGSLVLTTGNKSEMAVGYATLYGDMAGGFAVLKDVYKTLVYELARWRNARAGMALIPESTLTKPPSAELRPNQKDVDSLPPYDVLDPILAAYVEEDRGLGDVVRLGYDAATARRVMDLVDRSEYKRRQAPPGIKITERAFGRDRRLPLTNGYHGTPGAREAVPEDAGATGTTPRVIAHIPTGA
jgi:NAD+ synthase (glutamine-hydrolysing)